MTLAELLGRERQICRAIDMLIYMAEKDPKPERLDMIERLITMGQRVQAAINLAWFRRLPTGTGWPAVRTTTIPNRQRTET